MNTPSALLILGFVGFVFGILASASERSGRDIAIPIALVMMVLLPAIGAIQHFWWGWPWWPVVIPAHAVTAFAGVIFFNFMARTSRELERSQNGTQSGDEYDLDDDWLELEDDGWEEDEGWEEDDDWEDDDYWDVDDERAGSAEELDVPREPEDADRRPRED